MTVVPAEKGAQKIVYPRSYTRRHQGWFELTPARVVALLWIVASSLLALLVHILLSIAVFIAMVYLVIPTIDGHGVDTMRYTIRSYLLRRRGGYPDVTAVLDPSEDHPSQLCLVVYELPNETDLTVVRNLATGQDIVLLEITGWGSISSCDPVDRMIMENSFNQVLRELSSREYFLRYAGFSMRRDPDPTSVWAELDDSMGDGPLREFVDAAVEEIYINGQDGVAPVRRYFVTLQVGVNKKAQQLIDSGVSRDLRKIPAIDSMLALREALQDIDMTVDILNEEGLATTLREMHDPMDEATSMLLAQEQLRSIDERQDEVPLPLQREVIPNYRVGRNWIAFGESYHTILAVRKIKVNEPPPGWLDDYFIGGLTDFSIAGISVVVGSKEGATALARLKRTFVRGREADQASRGSLPTGRQEIEHSAALSAFDELDLSEGELAMYSKFIIVSGASPEELDEDVRIIMKMRSRDWVTYTRIDGPARQLPAFHFAVGLK